jgi:uncharacterized protein (TIGR00661 family)
MMSRIAFFISPHGFGHAARAASVMEAMVAMDSSIRFDIFTTVPSWFFEDNLCGLYRYHYVATDLGLVQRTAFEADIDQTLRHLNRMLPYNGSQVTEISQYLKHLNSKLVICDIAPLGLLIARKAGIPSVLVENFTWDWIYKRYADFDPQICAHIKYLGRLYKMADFHIQTEPLCNPKPVDFLTGPASRKIRLSKNSVREKLGLPSNHKLVLITTGGVPQEYRFMQKLYGLQDIHFVIPGGCPAAEIRKNLFLLPHHSDYFHPDLVNASDAVIGKAGYSTIAEVYHAGVPFGFIPCNYNPEAEKLVEFIQAEMQGDAIHESEFQSGSWANRLENLVNMPRIKRKVPNGADQIGEFIIALLQ